MHSKNPFANVVLPQAKTQQTDFGPQMIPLHKKFGRKKKVLLIFAKKKKLLFFFDQTFQPQIKMPE